MDYVQNTLHITRNTIMIKSVNDIPQMYEFLTFSISRNLLCLLTVCGSTVDILKVIWRICYFYDVTYLSSKYDLFDVIQSGAFDNNICNKKYTSVIQKLVIFQLKIIKYLTSCTIATWCLVPSSTVMLRWMDDRFSAVLRTGGTCKKIIKEIN